jgi:PP-loop superfamily ATP-utilizing enzyme
MGFRQLRVRDHGSSARVEVGSDEITRARSEAESISTSLAALGFLDVEIATYRAPSERARN